MTPSEHDAAAPDNESGSGAGSPEATREAQPPTGASSSPHLGEPAQAAAAQADAPATEPAAAAQSPEPPPTARPPASWLASAQGLVPVMPQDSVSYLPDAPPSADPDATRQFPLPGPRSQVAARAAVTTIPIPARESARAGSVVSQPEFTPSPASVPPASRRGFPIGRLLLAFILGLLLAGGVAVGALYAYDQQYVDRILPGVRVGSVDLSGLDRATARDRLEQAYASFGEGTVEVKLGESSTTISFAEIGRKADVDRMLDDAFAVGRSSSTVGRILGELQALSRTLTIPPAITVNGQALVDRVAAIARAAESQPVDATAVVTQTGFATTPAHTGVRVDQGTAAADIAAQLATVDAPSQLTITLNPEDLPPAITDANAQLARAQAAIMAQDVTLAAGTDHWTVPAAAVHGWFSFAIVDGRVRVAVDAKAALAVLKPLAKDIDQEPVSATLKLAGNKVALDKPSRQGRTFNASKTTTVVVNALRNRAGGTLAVGAAVAPVLAIVEPALTTKEAKAIAPKMVPISSWTTNYFPSDHNGFGVNIRIPTSQISGQTVAPGATFSFWNSVGPVTKAAGYQEGGAIINGHTEPQGALGGGICSCSTTLFNAALRAGFKMGDRLNHYYYIDRYPVGLDATVFISASGQAQDMTWTNDTDTPVLIQGINRQTSVTFKLWGIPNGRQVSFSEPIVKNPVKGHTETVYTKSLPAGTRKQDEYQVDGMDVTVTRTVKDAAGTVIHQDTYYSHYTAMTGIIMIGGTKPKPTTTTDPAVTTGG